MPLTSGPDDPRHDALVALRDIIVAGERYRHAVSERLGITLNESAAVSYLYDRQEVGQTELAHELDITTSSTTTLIDRLEANGLAERVAHPVDRRRWSVHLTAHGRRTLEHSREWFRHAFDHVAPADLPTVTVALRTVATDLRQQAERIQAEH